MVKQEANGRFSVYFYLGSGKHAKRIRKRGFKTERDALDFIAIERNNYKNQLNLDFGDPVTLRQVSAFQIAEMMELKRKQSSIRVSQRAFEMFDDVFALDRPALELTSTHFAEFLRLREQAVKPQTAHNDGVAIRAACRSAQRGMPELEGLKIPFFPRGWKKPKSQRERVISAEEENALVAFLPVQMIQLLTIALDTGMRVTEIFTLRWHDIHSEPTRHLHHGYLIVRATKTGDRRTGTTHDRIVPITTPVWEVLETRSLERLVSETPSDLVFPAPPDHLAELELACGKCEPKIIYGRDKEYGLVFHDTRHTAVTRMLQDGVDPKTIAQIVGHSQINTTMRYGHATAESLGRALEALEKRSRG